MAKTTTNLGLIKPERSDNYNVDVMANNMDAIDAVVGALEDRITVDANGNIIGNVIGRVISTYTVTFSSTYVVSNAGTGRYRGGVSNMYLQPLPSVTYSCPSTISVQCNRNDTNYGMDDVTVTVYTYNGVDWSKYSSNSIGSSGGTLSLSFPTSTKGVFIEVSGGGNNTFKFPLPIIK